MRSRLTLLALSIVETVRDSVSPSFNLPPAQQPRP